jgi:hypothetical protein
LSAIVVDVCDELSFREKEKFSISNLVWAQKTGEFGKDFHHHNSREQVSFVEQN